MNNTQRILSFVLISAFALGTLVSSAFAQAPIPTGYVSTGCANITTTLRIGKHDSTTGGQVSILQNFLHARGYLSVAPTGYFGPLTFRAVEAFQLASASGAADGIVGPQTQAHIRAIDCAIVVPPPSSPITNAPVISAISPSSGSAGTTVTITGSGFMPSDIVHFSIGGLNATSTNGTSISFVVPTSIGPYCKPDQACALYMELLNAGTYPVSVENANGTSNVVSFTIIGNATAIPQ
jgi:peptidoglycan hydrolase-like protein with peptidoglycan-binding domain